ncbi:MAG: glycerophosphodiester phosphodiesterase [Mogibacterium sp.]|nr:glycerophosphodiester phosphodiesterase [Mogibacterium sp.]
MNNTNKKKTRNRLLVIIAVMLIICVLAVVYILSTAGKSRETVPENEDITQEETADNDKEDIGTAEAEALEKASAHVYSHRGSEGDDELTFAAYDKAIEAGSRFIEVDMVVSADGTIYAAHDDYAKEKTGIDGYFSGMTDKQIDELKTTSGHSILKLSDIFDEYGDSVTYIIDIKYSSARNIEAFTDLVKKYGYENNVIAASFYLAALRQLEPEFPDMTRLYLAEDQGTFNGALNLSYVDIICVPADIMTDENLKTAHEHDKEFSAWTLNKEEDITKAIDMGADSYFTDDTGLAIELEKKYRDD